jgi:hypothetical protein
MLSHVTFTGWDRHTDLAELATFLEDCRQETVEIAVLQSSTKIDEDRYPTALQAAEILRTAKAAGQRTALHLCGQAARTVLDSATSDRHGSKVSISFDAAHPLRYADRVQVNVEEGFWTPGPEKYLRALEAAYALGKPVIVQSRDLDIWPDVRYFTRGAERMVPFLFDRSAGRGEAQDLWPEPPESDLLVGYAGGLGPDTAAALVGRIAGTRPHARFWIDMESGIRALFPSRIVGDPPPSQSYVSITKCSRVMTAVGPWLEGR